MFLGEINYVLIGSYFSYKLSNLFFPRSTISWYLCQTVRVGSVKQRFKWLKRFDSWYRYWKNNTRFEDLSSRRQNIYIFCFVLLYLIKYEIMNYYQFRLEAHYQFTCESHMLLLMYWEVQIWFWKCLNWLRVKIYFYSTILYD